jgi:hypothetical protein
MAERSILHVSKLEEFKAWLTAKGIKWELANGAHQVMRFRISSTVWSYIYDRIPRDGSTLVHYTVEDRAVRIVWDFIRETKKLRSDDA